MRYLLLFVPLVIAGCADNYGSRYSYNQGRSYYGSDNCGTPDNYRPCRSHWYRGY